MFLLATIFKLLYFLEHKTPLLDNYETDLSLLVEHELSRVLVQVKFAGSTQPLHATLPAMSVSVFRSIEKTLNWTGKSGKRIYNLLLSRNCFRLLFK